MPSWTKDQLLKYERKQANAENRRGAPRVQEQQVNIPKPKDGATVHRNKPEIQKMDEQSHPRFKITIRVFVASNYRRDGDGILSTCLDCLVRAVKGL